MKVKRRSAGFLLRYDEWQQSFSNADLSIVRLSVVNFSGFQSISPKLSDNFLSKLA
jgi:hypothetical protein